MRVQQETLLVQQCLNFGEKDAFVQIDMSIVPNFSGKAKWLQLEKKLEGHLMDEHVVITRLFGSRPLRQRLQPSRKLDAFLLLI